MLKIKTQADSFALYKERQTGEHRELKTTDFPLLHRLWVNTIFVITSMCYPWKMTQISIHGLFENFKSHIPWTEIESLSIYLTVCHHRVLNRGSSSSIKPLERDSRKEILPRVDLEYAVNSRNEHFRQVSNILPRVEFEYAPNSRNENFPQVKISSLSPLKLFEEFLASIPNANY